MSKKRKKIDTLLNLYLLNRHIDNNMLNKMKKKRHIIKIMHIELTYWEVQLFS